MKIKFDFSYRQKFIFVLSSRDAGLIEILLVHLPADPDEVLVCLVSICQIETDTYATLVTLSQGLKSSEKLTQMRDWCEEGAVGKILGIDTERRVYRAEEVLDFDKTLSNSLELKEFISSPDEGDEDEVSNALDYFSAIYEELDDIL